MGKQFGAVYLILGTCIAAGLLGLPVVTAQHSTTITTIMIFSAWLLMTAGAWCLLQVILTMPLGANLITMSQKTLGNTVKNITWFIYLFLLYSIISAYLAASGDLLQHLLNDIHLTTPRFLTTIIAAFLLGSIVTHGIRSVDFANRILMSTKIIICLLLMSSLIPFVHAKNFTPGDMHWNNSTWLVIICAFGYAIILPSIRDYLGNHKKQLTRVVILGSLIPMVLYFAWIAIIQGALSRHTLTALNHSPNTNSLLMTHIVALTQDKIIQSLGVIFISICSITGFLGVSVCLMDFLADGIRIEKKGKNKLSLAGIAFLPPTIIVIADPAIFIRALSYAGICCLYILIGLPIAMYCATRYKKITAE